MFHRVIFGESGQVLRHVPPRVVGSATAIVQDLRYQVDDDDELLFDGSATVASDTWTLDDAAGRTEGDPRRIPLASTTGLTADTPCILQASDGSELEHVVIAGVEASVAAVADAPLASSFESGDSLKKNLITIPVPAALTTDDTFVDNEYPLRVVWTYTIGGQVYRVPEQIRVVRASPSGEGTTAEVIGLIRGMYPEILERTGSGARVDQWVGIARRFVMSELRRKGIDPTKVSWSESLSEALMWRTLMIAASNGEVPKNRDQADFSGEVKDHFDHVFNDLTQGLPGKDTVDLTHKETAEATHSQRPRKLLLGL